MTASAPDNFLGLPPPQTAYKSARYAVLPVPYDSAASFRAGAREGPRAIISASQHVEFLDEELQVECHAAGIATLDPIEPNLAGPEAMHEDLFSRIVRDGKFLFTLGGDHSITSALVRAVKSRQRRLSLLQIDAHHDLRDSFYGAKYAHACVMRRVHEMGVNIVPVGVRAWSDEERRFLKRNRMEVITARQCFESDDWLDRALNALGDTVYVTIDIDGLDPAYAPGTGTPEPGGLDWYQVCALLRLVAAEKTVIAADIVEVMPIPGQVVTEFLAARLAYKLMCYVETKG
jgi:agmatinase